MTATQIDQKNRFKPVPALGPLTSYMVVFFIIPIGVFLVLSFWTVREWNVVTEWNLNNYIDVFSSPLYTKLILRSIAVGFGTGALSVLVVYPLAYTMAFRFEKYRDPILFLLAISLFSNYLGCTNSVDQLEV